MSWPGRTPLDRSGRLHAADDSTVLPITIRRAVPDDAASIVGIWTGIVAELTYSAVDRPFTIEAEREYLAGLSEREGILLAETVDRHVVGFQSLDQWTKLFHSMDRVAQIGTFVRLEWRGSRTSTTMRS